MRTKRTKEDRSSHATKTWELTGVFKPPLLGSRIVPVQIVGPGTMAWDGTTLRVVASLAPPVNHFRLGLQLVVAFLVVPFVSGLIIAGLSQLFGEFSRGAMTMLFAVVWLPVLITMLGLGGRRAAPAAPTRPVSLEFTATQISTVFQEKIPSEILIVVAHPKAKGALHFCPEDDLSVDEVLQQLRAIAPRAHSDPVTSA